MKKAPSGLASDFDSLTPIFEMVTWEPDEESLITNETGEFASADCRSVSLRTR